MSYLYICLYVYFHIIYSFSVSMKSCWVFISVYRLVYNGGMMWIISTTLLFVPDLYLLWNYYHSYAIFLSLDPLFWFSLSLQFIIIIKIFTFIYNFFMITIIYYLVYFSSFDIGFLLCLIFMYFLLLLILSTLYHIFLELLLHIQFLFLFYY